MVIVGSPVNGWQPTKKMIEWLDSLSQNQLRDTKASAFDTRVTMFLHGDAAGKIGKKLEKAGATIIDKPHGFFVKGQKGPLLAGELARAKDWSHSLKNIFDRSDIAI